MKHLHLLLDGSSDSVRLFRKFESDQSVIQMELVDEELIGVHCFDVEWPQYVRRKVPEVESDDYLGG